MNVLALRPLRAEPSLPAADASIARLEIFDTMAAAEPYWRLLEQRNSLATPYQRYDFLALWQRHVGASEGMTPFIVVGFNMRGQPLFLWPFGSRKVAGLRVVEFLGGKHANFNMGLWRRDVAAGIEPHVLDDTVSQLADGVDLIKLINQPLTWGGTTNPFALLPHQRSANFGFSGTLIPDYEALLRAHTNSATRKKMRKKERALANFGTVSFEQTRDPQAIRRTLDAFFKQKSARMKQLGVQDAFAPPGVRRFIEAAAAVRLPDGEPLLEIYSLSVDDIIVATYGGMLIGGRFSAMFNSIVKDRFAAESPGEQLLTMLVQHCCARGVQTFDLGIGQANYKALFCEDIEPLFDSYLPLSTGGRLLSCAYAALSAGKRTIKQHATLWSSVRTWRRLRARLSSA
jgi:CelD/BcsL family acetyltransferase involved in cellulose biosynthesis